MVGPSSHELEARVRRLEDRMAIEELAIRYGYVVDERDEAGIRALFTSDASLSSADGVVTAVGVDAIVETYLRRMEVVGASNHFCHGAMVRFDAEGAAHGIVSAHAEVERDGVPMQVALRYRDRYRKDEDEWRIAQRVMSYMYFLPHAELSTSLGAADSMRAYGDRRPRDWPDVLNSGDTSWLVEFSGH